MLHGKEKCICTFKMSYCMYGVVAVAKENGSLGSATFKDGSWLLQVLFLWHGQGCSVYLPKVKALLVYLHTCHI